MGWVTHPRFRNDSVQARLFGTDIALLHCLDRCSPHFFQMPVFLHEVLYQSGFACSWQRSRDAVGWKHYGYRQDLQLYKQSGKNDVESMSCALSANMYGPGRGLAGISLGAAGMSGGPYCNLTPGSVEAVHTGIDASGILYGCVVFEYSIQQMLNLLSP